MSDVPLAVQTTYAELIDQLRLAEIGRFPNGSTFRKRTIKGREYWYVQEPTGAGSRPPERYLGPDAPAIRQAVEAGVRAHADVAERRTIVRSLLGAGLPSPDRLSGQLIKALSDAGVFRLRAVLVGTVAYHCYTGLLGIRLPAASLRTGDLDLAQDYGIALALNDRLDRSLLEILKEIEPAFSAVSALDPVQASSSYQGPRGYRVDVLTTNRGAEHDATVDLPPLRSGARPLRFLDFLLRDSIDAAVLVDTGVLVKVPSPARFALHKLIVAQRRIDQAKVRKDLLQAESLLAHLAARDPFVLAEVWHEAEGRGKTWSKLLTQGLELIAPGVGDSVRSKIAP